MKGEGSGFGKVILFGEHIVVFGSFAVVASVKESTHCVASVVSIGDLSPEEQAIAKSRPIPWIVRDNRLATPDYIVTKADEQAAAHDLTLNFLASRHIELALAPDQAWLIELSGSLVAASGLGASAANCVALARAVASARGFTLSDAEVNAAAWVGEGGYHGTPSGLDNTAATYGGIILFRKAAPAGLDLSAAAAPPADPAAAWSDVRAGVQREAFLRGVGEYPAPCGPGGAPPGQTAKDPVAARVPVGGALPAGDAVPPIYIVVGSTGVTASTKDVVAAVAAAVDARGEGARGEIMEDFERSILQPAVAAVHAADWSTVGALMSANHALLRDTIGVSSPLLEKLVAAATGAGALGAKLSGTGCGGVMIALATADVAPAVAAAVEAAGSTATFTLQLA